MDLGILEKTNRAIEQSEYDAVIVTGPDNVQYLSGAVQPYVYTRPTLPMFVFWPKGGVPTIICPVKWESTVRESGWIKRIVTYTSIDQDAARVEILAQLASELGKSHPRLGVDLSRVSWTLFDVLKEKLAGAELVGCDEWLGHLRMVKTGPEMALLEQIAHLTDHGINAELHHVIVDRYKTSLTLAEEIRVHCMERGLDVVGYHAASQVAGGDEVKKFWSLPPLFGFSTVKALEAGEWVRVEARTCLRGYWSDAGRMMVMGEPTSAQSDAYNDLVMVRKAAVRYLKPGARCCDVFESVRAKAAEADIMLSPDFGLGHGVGITPHESPYLNASDETTLEPGMVLVIDPIIQFQDGMILRSKDTVRLTETGCEVIGWYKDWREPYIPIAAI